MCRAVCRGFGEQGGVSEVQLSVLASLELARRLSGASDAELVQAAREYCTRAWDVVRHAGRTAARFAQSTRQIGQRILPYLSKELNHEEGNAEASYMGQRLGEVGVVVKELDRDGRAICHQCTDLRQGSLDLIDRVRSRILMNEGSTAAISAGFEDVMFAYKDAASALSNSQAPVSIGRIWAQESLLMQQASAIKEQRLLHLGGRASTEGAPDTACALMQLAQAEPAPVEKVDRETVLAELLKELVWLHEQLAGTRSFWEDTWGSVRRLSLKQDHLETMLKHAGTLKNRILRERSAALFDDYQSQWGTLVQACHSPKIAG